MSAKKLFFWSDLHLFHEAVLSFDERPFDDLDHMHKSLIKNYNATVPSDGVCYFLGDVSFGSTAETKAIIDQMQGTKICIMGNHDKGMTAMYNSGFDVVLYNATIYIAGQKVTLSHCPLRGVFREDTSKMRKHIPGENWHGEYELGDKFSVADDGQFHLHGHCHSRGTANGKEIRTNRQYDVGCPGNGFRPVSASQIESWIMKELRG